MARIGATAGFTIYPPPPAPRNSNGNGSPRRKLQDDADDDDDGTSPDKSKTKSWATPAASQQSSPLCQLAPELRSMIFNYALLIDDSKSLVPLGPVSFIESGAPSDQHHSSPPQWAFRPVLKSSKDSAIPKGRKRFHQAPSQQFALLRTCQFIYNEANHLPIIINTHVLHYPPARALNYPLPTIMKSYLSHIPESRVHQIKHVHVLAGADRLRAVYDPETAADRFHASGYRSESLFAELCVLRCGGGVASRNMNTPKPSRPLPLNPTDFTITVRDFEWYRTPLALFPALLLNHGDWGAVFGSVQRLIMELETRADNACLLETEVQRIAAHSFNIGFGSELKVRVRNDDSERGEDDDSNDGRYSKSYWRRRMFESEERSIKWNHELLERTNGASSDIAADLLEEALVTDDKGQQFVPIVLFTIRWDLVGVEKTTATERRQSVDRILA